MTGPSSSRPWRAYRIATRSRTWSRRVGTSKRWCCPEPCAGISKIASCSTEIKRSFSNSIGRAGPGVLFQERKVAREVHVTDGGHRYLELRVEVEQKVERRRFQTRFLFLGRRSIWLVGYWEANH